MQSLRSWMQLAASIVLVSTVMLAASPVRADPFVRMRTVLGEFFITLTPENAPATVENFVSYVDRGAYDDSFIHRSDPGFVVQGGGFAWPESASQVDAVDTDPPVVNEFNVSNTRSTVAMARLGGEQNSATSQWFVNLDDNGFLDAVDGGFTVFGTIDSAGMQVVDDIAGLEVVNAGDPFAQLPVIDLVGTSVLRENLVFVTSSSFVSIAAPGASVLPSGRAIAVAGVATGFASVVNPSSSAAASCRVAPSTSVPADFTYWETDPATNAVIGEPNAPVDIAAGGRASFVFSFSPSAPFAATRIEFDYACYNTAAPAPVVAGVNTFELSADTAAPADVVALAATLGQNGIVDIPGASGSGAFSVATVNLGSAETIEVSADTGDADLPVALFVCETNPASGACLADPTTLVTRTFDPAAAPTFAVFVQGSGSVPFAPGANRAFVRFRNASGAQRGGTSVAIQTVP